MKPLIRLREALLALAKLFLLLLALVLPVAAQTWIELSPAGLPPLPFGGPAPVFYDGANNRLIAFYPGNPPYSGNPPGNGNEVAILTNANGLGGTPTWTKLQPTGAPPFMNALGSVVYDANTNRLIVYGGCFAGCSPALSNVFILTNANGLGGPPVWSQSSVTNPQARAYHSAVYDSSSDRMIAFAGHFAFFGTDQNDTRVLSNATGLLSPSTWTTLATSGGPPAIRNLHTAIYDEANNRMTIFAGTNYILCCAPYIIHDYNDTWVLSNANGMGGTSIWTQLSPLGGPPDGRSGHSAVYDPVNNRMIIFGGDNWNQAAQTDNPIGDLWQLSNANGLGGAPVWTQLAQLGTPPGPRFYHTAAFDAGNQRMILLGGRDPRNLPSNRGWGLILNQAPNALCHDITVSAGPDCTADASIDNGSFDPDSGDTITTTQSPSGPYPIGATQVTLTVTDNHGASSQSTATVTVIDNRVPSFTTVPTVDKRVLWPPDHKMIDVTVDYAAADNCSAPVCALSVVSNEPINGTGDGDMAPDWEIVDAHHVRLRAERAGTGSGRIYTIAITCVDGAGNSSSKTVTVNVPKSQK